MTEHDDSAETIRTVWTEAELDDALSALHAQPAPGAQALAETRARLFTAIGLPSDESPPGATRRRASWRGWLAGAAAVAMLVAVGLVTLNGGTPTASAAVQTLRRAAGTTIDERDLPIRPGQYRYVATRIWALAQGEGENGQHFAWRNSYLTQTWMPYDQTQNWVQDNSSATHPEWVLGSAQQALKSGLPLDKIGPPHGRIQARCGDFNSVYTGSAPICSTRGDLKQPTSAWLATLPRDPRRLLTTLEDDGSEPEPDREGGVVEHGAMMLSSGLVPADLRAALYRTFALLPDLQVTEQSVNLDGRKGIALGITDSTVRREVIIDPVSGQFIGQRLVQAVDDPRGLKAGTLLDSSSVVTGVVDAVGAKPAR